MRLLLMRDTFLPLCTLGKLYIDGKLACQTLEDAMRQRAGQPVLSWKIPHETAIPTGTYKVTMTMSNRFKKVMPLLVDVPGFDGVRIHAGNTHADTEGCILVGTGRLVDKIVNSRMAVDALYPRIQSAIDKGETVTIEVTNGLA